MYSSDTIKVTPSATSNATSRKRKMAETVASTHQPSFRQSLSFDTPCNFLSSTMNESIANDLERCNLDSFVSNFYIERSDITDTPTTALSHLNCSVQLKEATTPTKCKSHSSTRTSPMQKLGSPERNEILYPTLQRNGNCFSRFADGAKRFSPAKKRLFERKLRDPIYIFWNDKNKFPEIIKKILSHLSDKDLYNCSKVSRNWKNAIIMNSQLKDRLYYYTQSKVMNKENYAMQRFESSPIEEYFCGSPFKDNESPVLNTSRKFYEITNLKESQHVEMCLQCGEPCAIVESNISQCSRMLCGFIRCLKCNSISATGPKDFKDKCQQSQLVVDEPKSKYSLMWSPLRGTVSESGIPSFLCDSSYSSTLSTSGYVTESDTSLMHTSRHSGSFNKEKMQVLRTSNSNYLNKRSSLDMNLYSPVLPVKPLKVKEREEVIEPPSPPSPPKVKEVACSKRSRRNLKRLRF